MLRRLLVVLLLAAPAAALAELSAAETAELFAARGVTGTLLIRSPDGTVLAAHGEAGAAHRRPAASTFKIPNALIALEEGIASDEDHVFAWDGVERDLPVWNGDQTLRSAFQVSCVWCFQRIAADVGEERYRRWLRRFDYGVLAEDFPLTEFWLDGSLRISVLGQLAFLEQLQRQTLPLSAETYAAMERVMLTEAGADHRLYAKSGWFTRSEPGTGWYVGWIEHREEVAFFALAIDTHDAADLPARVEIVRSALTALELLPAGS